MRIVVTGFDARSARPAVGEQRMSMAFLMAEAFRIWGHQVQAELCHPMPGSGCADFYDEADLIYVGLASPLGLTSSYAYHALLVLARYWNDPRLRLFIDDPDQGKILYGARSAARNETITDPLFSNKVFRNRYMVDDLTETDKAAMYRVCELLTFREDWPRTFIPVQSHWCSPALITGPVVGIDPTQIAMDLIPWQPQHPREKRLGWVVEPYRAKRWAMQVPLRGMRYTLDGRRPQQRLGAYQIAVGALETPPAGPTQSGWWTPAATLAMRTGTFYTTDFSRLSGVDGFEHSAYYLLPSAYEDLGPHEQDVIIEQQSEEIINSAPELIDVIKELISDRSQLGLHPDRREVRRP